MYKPSIYSIWVARFFSLTLAVLLWYYVYDLDRNTERRIIDIEFRNPPADFYTDFNYSKQKVNVEVSGKKDAVSEVLPSLNQLKYYVDLKKAVTGKHSYEIKQEKNENLDALLKHFEVDISKDRDSVSIHYEKIINKEIPIQLQIIDKLDKNYKIMKFSHEPDTVTLRGPENILKEINEIKTKKLVMQKRRYDYRGFVKLDDDNLPDTIYIPTVKRVKVHVVIGKNIPQKRLENIPITILANIQKGLTHVEKDLKLDYIIIEGLYNDMQDINFDDFRGYISISKIDKPGKYTFKVQVNTPEKFVVKDYSPKQITLTIKDLE